MSVGRLKRNMMKKLINARIDLNAYLQLRKAKGYMSVSENDHLRENLFELCKEMIKEVVPLRKALTREERDALRQAGEAVASAAICLMTGHRDCPLYITVNVETLERCLETLTSSIQTLDAVSSHAHV
ncbi:biofilm formation regulator BssR [Trabulsiella odontotermitis]|uniref:Biofilm formation regulatory protein BssR n=1 Tax=Trabulsiella odontotermitis TaxID=379893 RepID=A0A0L0H230_9ENTR|nr:biofilm formation regulator BssR [Trabulsiella odontotermitis]KNC95039.1 biofilm formation regulatory protein BssR [Trabulsiella odontotermitis]